MSSNAMAQVNVRMDQGLKIAGDTVLDQMGISPTKLIRAVWAKVACGAKACDQLVSVLAAEPSAGTTLATGNREQGTSARHARLVARQEALADELGLSLTSFVPHDDEELDDLLSAEYFADEGASYGA